MRLVVYVGADTGSVVIWAVGFRDPYLPTDCYNLLHPSASFCILLRRRIPSERHLGTVGAFRIGKVRRRPR